VGKWAIRVVLIYRGRLWYQYVVRFHAGGDNIRQKQLFSHVKRHDVLHVLTFRAERFGVVKIFFLFESCL
jgi:hypothetical protein